MKLKLSTTSHFDFYDFGLLKKIHSDEFPDLYKNSNLPSPKTGCHLVSLTYSQIFSTTQLQYFTLCT